MFNKEAALTWPPEGNSPNPPSGAASPLKTRPECCIFYVADVEVLTTVIETESPRTSAPLFVSPGNTA